MIDHYEFTLSAKSIPYQYSHPLIIAGLVRWLKPQVVVEVGTHLGITAVHIGRALQENGSGHLYCIDNFCWSLEKQEEQWHANIARCGVGDVVTLLKGRSQEVQWPERVDMAYIDGNHRYDVCRHDTEKARTLGAQVIVLHDTVQCEGPRKMSEEFRLYAQWKPWDIMEDVREGGLTILKKRDPKGPLDPDDISDMWDEAT